MDEVDFVDEVDGRGRRGKYETGRVGDGDTGRQGDGEELRITNYELRIARDRETGMSPKDGTRIAGSDECRCPRRNSYFEAVLALACSRAISLID